MKLEAIFVDEDSGEGIYSIKYPGEEVSEFERLHELWLDTRATTTYFVQNVSYLRSGYYGNISIAAAVTQTRIETDALYDAMYDLAEMGFDNLGENLDSLFEPLGDAEKLQLFNMKSKAKPPAKHYKRMIRMYALRVSPNTYIITGGAIKLTELMQDHPDTQKELEKLEQVKSFLASKGIKTLENLTDDDEPE